MTTTPVRATGPQDLLAYLPYRLGFQPAESLVVVSLRGPRHAVGLVVRVDLADLDPDRADGERLADWLAHHTAADGPNRVVVVVYTAADLRAAPAPPERRALDLVVARLDSVLPGTEAWVVGERGYRSVDCSDPVCCPPAGRPLADVTGSRMAATMVLEGLTYAPTREARYRLPSASADARAQAARAARRWEQRRERLVRDGEAADGADATGEALGALRRWGADGLAAWRRSVRQVADGGPGVLTPSDLGRLGAALADRWVRDAVLVSLVPGTRELAAATAARRVTSETDLATGEVIARIVDPRVGERPEPVVLGPVREILEAVAAHVPQRRRAPVCTLLALIAWWDGDGGSAGARLTEALDADPGYALATLLASALHAAVPPGWVRRGYRDADRAQAERDLDDDAGERAADLRASSSARQAERRAEVG